MRQLLFPFIFLLFSLSVFGQNDGDIIRYSQTDFSGDARFIGLAGSVGALGANTACMQFNPAALGIYLQGEFVASGLFRTDQTKTTHFGNTYLESKTNIHLPHFAFAAANEEPNPFTGETASRLKKNWSRRHVIAIGISQPINFNQNISFNGNAQNSSIVHDMQNAAIGKDTGTFNYAYEGNAWNSYLINDSTFTGTKYYWGMVPRDSYLRQQREIQERGKLQEISLAYAWACDNKYYLGGSINVLRAKFSHRSVHQETDAWDTLLWFKGLEYEESYTSDGLGANVKIGGLCRLFPWMRIGGALHSKSFISLTDIYSSKLITVYDLDSIGTNSNADLIEPYKPYIRGQKFEFQDTGRFRYSVRMPGKWMISAAWILGKYAAINIDVEGINYSKGNLKSHGKDYFFAVNQQMKEKYTKVYNYRIGAEWNVKPIIIRLGYALYQSPQGQRAENLRKTFYTVGIGLKHDKDLCFDFAFRIQQNKGQYYLYNPDLIPVSLVDQRVYGFYATVVQKF